MSATAAPPSAERRIAPRRQPAMGTLFRLDSDGPPEIGLIWNISRSGVFIKTASPLPVGSKVDLKFTVVMDGIETIEGEGEVVRVESNPAGMGVVFRKLESYSQRLVEQLLTQPL